jgi:transcriptional antiterminator Rof (Rho-off)
MTTDYRPIACEAYSVLEVLALRREPVTVHAVGDDGALVEHRGRVADLRTREGAEYLVLHDDREGVVLRLDRIEDIYTDSQRVYPGRESAIPR